MSRQARRVAHIREEILRAAARAFARRGFEATTMQEIAAEAGYTVPSLYGYFDGKQKIVEGLVSFLADGLLGPLRERAPAGLTFSQRLELVVRRQLEFAEQLGPGVAVFFTLKPDMPRKKSMRVGGAVVPGSDVLARQLAQWLEQAASAGDLGRHGAEDLGYVLKAIMHAVFLQWLHGGAKGRLADRAASIVELFLHGVAARRSANAVDDI